MLMQMVKLLNNNVSFCLVKFYVFDLFNIIDSKKNKNLRGVILMYDFKKILSIVIVLCLVFTPLFSTNVLKVFGADENVKYGDVNNDGNINSLDSAIMSRYLLGIIEESKINFKAADLNGDGRINSVDYALLGRYLLEMISEFPVEKINPTPTPTPTSTPTPNVPVLDAPKDLKVVSQTSRSVTLSWVHSGGDDVEFIIYTEDSSVTARAKSSPHTVENLTPGRTYEFTVAAVSDEGTFSEHSNVCTVTTKVKTSEDFKDALIYNFNRLGTNYSVIYEGDMGILGDIISTALEEAVKDSSKPFILEGVSYSASGAVGNLKVTFEFSYNDDYHAAAYSKDDLESVLLKRFTDRIPNINIVYKDNIKTSEIDEILNSIMKVDTYLASSINNISYEFLSSLGVSGIKLTVSYYTTKEQEEYVDKTVNFIVSKLVNDDMSDHEKEKLIHDYILNFVDYADSDEYNDPYSALYYGKSKCNGYAMLTYKMLTAAGIENVIATNEDHAWNIVKIEGNWYHLDTTWDDGKEKGYGFYGYYNLTDEQLILGPEGLDGRNYYGMDGISCTTNYIEALKAANEENDGKYEHILKDLEKNKNYVEINDFKIYPSMNLMYNEVLLKEGEKVGLVDPIIPVKVYKDSIYWSTSDENVVKVKDGVITAQKEGVAIIAAQPMFDPLFRTGFFCVVRVIQKESDGSTAQNISKQNFIGFTDENVVPHVVISSSENVNNSTTVVNITDELEGKTHFYGEALEVRTSSKVDWMEIGFKLSQEQLRELDINELMIYCLDEETGEMVPQATKVDDVNGIVTATLSSENSKEIVNALNLENTYEQSRKIILSNVQAQSTTVNVAFVIDSEYSDQNTLNIFKTNITRTISNLVKKSNVRVAILESRDNRNIEIGQFSCLKTSNYYATQRIEMMLEQCFKTMKPANKTPTPNELLGRIQTGLVSGSKILDNYKIQGAKHKEYALFYTKHRGYFSDSNSILTKLGNTTGLVVGQTIAYYDGGKIAYNESNVDALVKYLLEGNNAHLTPEYTGKGSWMLSQGGDNVKNDVIVLQKLLITHGYLKMLDDSEFGIFGPLTKQAVENYQRDNRLEVDGIVGKNTWMALNRWDTSDVLWDDKKGEPNRTTWTYRYTLQNKYYFNGKSSVKLISPVTDTEINVIDGIDIVAVANNCHHVALFIDGEWVKTEYNNTGNVESINLEYHFHPLDIGKHSVQVKGRSVPNGDSSTLVESKIFKVEVPAHFRGSPNEFALEKRVVYNG